MTDTEDVKTNPSDDTVEEVAYEFDEAPDKAKAGKGKKKKQGKLGLIAMLLGIGSFIAIFVTFGISWIPFIGWVCSCFLGMAAIICALGAIVLGVVALASKNEGTKGLGIVGLILGALYFVFLMLMIVISIIFSLTTFIFIFFFWLFRIIIGFILAF